LTVILTLLYVALVFVLGTLLRNLNHPGKGKENHDGNPFPPAWEISLSIVVADIVFARPRPPPAEVSELALADEPPAAAKT